MTTENLNELLDEFLSRWQIEDLEKMTLSEYVGVGNKDTFCQWVETKTRILGSIKGLTSIKFGIYERKNPSIRPKNYANDEKYSWLRRYGKTRSEAFENVKKDLIDIVRYSNNGQFSKIDNIILPDLYKWKVAFLYSNERLIPIYKKEVLLKIANHYGLETNNQTKISEIQKLLISNKPSDKNVYVYMMDLYDRFGRDKKIDVTTETSSKNGPEKRKTRKGTTQRNTEPYTITARRSYRVEQKHNIIQEALKKSLSDRYGEENIILEENYVDVKLIQPNYLGFYEVKSSSYASDCIREALGQVLFYSFQDQDDRTKKIFVVGQYPANEQDLSYIKYIKEIINVDFEYIYVDIE